MPDHLTGAHCTAAAADALGSVAKAPSAEFANAHIATAHAWMDLARLLADRPDLRPEIEPAAETESTGTRARNLMQLEIVADVEVTKANDIAAQPEAVTSE